MDHLDVGDVVSPVGRPVRRPCDLDSVERLSNRPVADGVEVRLEPGRVESRHPAQPVWLDEQARSVRGSAAAVR